MPTVFVYKPIRDASGKWIIDEVCTCGCLMSKHANTPLVAMEIRGHGRCTGCDCMKFVWKAFIYSDKP